MRLPFLLALAAAVACTDPPRPSVDPEDLAAFEYRLDAPDAVVTLPSELTEVSGLTVLPSGRLGAVQDESGTIYEVDPATGEIVESLVFEGDGDFEGVELVPDRAVWALRSDGDLYRVFRDSTGAPDVRTIETALRSRNDAEGLAYDPVEDRLLIACKAWPGPDIDDARAIYAFDFATETVSDAPVALLRRDDVDGDTNFRPSAIAVHPTSGQLYVLSSVREAIAVLDRDGALVAVSDLPPDLAPQPEGLAFAADGTLYVASEGAGGTPTLLRYTPTAR